MISFDFTLKLCDFGLSRIVAEENITSYVGTRWYRSPEQLLKSKKYGKEIDCWAIGCIFGEILDGYPLFPGNNDLDQLYLFQKLLGPFSKNFLDKFSSNKEMIGFNFPDIPLFKNNLEKYLSKIKKNGLDILTRLLAFDPSERISCEEALKHSFFEDCKETHEFNNIEHPKYLKTYQNCLNKNISQKINQSHHFLMNKSKNAENTKEKLKLYCNKIINNIFPTPQMRGHSIFEIENKTNEIINKFKEKYKSLVKNSIENKIPLSPANKKLENIYFLPTSEKTKLGINEFALQNDIKKLENIKLASVRKRSQDKNNDTLIQFNINSKNNLYNVYKINKEKSMKIFAQIKQNLHIDCPSKEEIKEESNNYKNITLKDFSKGKIMRKIAFFGLQNNTTGSIIKKKLITLIIYNYNCYFKIFRINFTYYKFNF